VIGQFNNYLLGFKVSTPLRHLYLPRHLHREKDIAAAGYNWLTIRSYPFAVCGFEILLLQSNNQKQL